VAGMKKRAIGRKAPDECKSPSESKAIKEENDASDYFKVYQEYSKVLRTWFAAYGIGAPVLILTNEGISKAIKASGDSKCIASFFLIGVSLQVVLAVINKMTMWGMYYGEVNLKFKKSRSYIFADWLAVQFWMDIFVDLATIAAFGGGTWKMFSLVA
jgi:hypothetical protein